MADLPEQLAVQPPPQPGEARPTSHLVVEDMLAKYDAGAVKYGMQHQHDNGRDHLADGYQEVLDLACYLRAEIEKRKTRATIRFEFTDQREQVARLKLDLAAARETIAAHVSVGIGGAMREPTRDEMEKALGESAEAFFDGWTVRRCHFCRTPIAGGPTACAGCVARADRAELVRQLEVAADRANEQTTRETQLVSERDEARAKYNVLDRSAGEEIAALHVELAKHKTDAPTPAPAGYIDERDHRRVTTELDRVTKERDGAVHALGAAKSERDMARKSLAETHHEVEAARKLHAAHKSDESVHGELVGLRRRFSKIIEIVDSGSPSWRETPAVKSIRALAAGES